MTGRLWALCTCRHYRVEHPAGPCSWRGDTCPCTKFEEKKND